jgi:hypothetical protein
MAQQPPDWLLNWEQQKQSGQRAQSAMEDAARLAASYAPNQPPVARNADGTFAKGNSGNLAGGNAPFVHRSVRAALDEAAPDVTSKVIQAARGGDMQACRIVMERVHAPKRSRAEPVKFNLDTTKSYIEQAVQVMRAMADGELDPETGKVVMECLSTAAVLTQHSEFEARIYALEAAQREGPPGARGGVVVGDIDEQGNLIQ